MAKETWMEVRVLVPARMQEEAALFLTDFSGRGVIIEEDMVAEANGRIVSFVLATTIDKEGTAWKKYGYLSWIGVDRAFQRTNLGLRLYRRLEDNMHDDGVRMIICDTEANNKGAIGFFRAMGFTQRRQHVWLAKTFKRPLRKKPGQVKQA